MTDRSVIAGIEHSRLFDETAQLIRVTGQRVRGGKYESTEADPVTINCATAPATSATSNTRVRALAEGGIQLSDVLVIWTTDVLQPVIEGDSGGPGDIIVHGGERWRVDETSRWDGFSETVLRRIEGQA